jgi:hypothetical protein
LQCQEHFAVLPEKEHMRLYKLLGFPKDLLA